MKKVLVINENIKVVAELKEVEGLSSTSINKENLYVLGLIGQANINGKLRTGNISEFLPDTEIGKILKSLWVYNQNYDFGTNKQMDLLHENGISVNLKDRNSFNKASDCLREKNLLNDRGITFGKKTLVNPLPLDIVNLAKSVIA